VDLSEEAQSTRARLGPLPVEPVGRPLATTAASLPDLPPAVPARRRRWLTALLAGIALLAAAGLGAFRYLVPDPVEAERLTARPLAFAIAGPGVLDSTAPVTLSARISGRLEAVAADRNDAVRQGMILARLAAEDMAHQLAAAEADAAAAAPMIDELRSQRAAADAMLRRAQAHLDRRRALAGTAVVSRDDLEIADAEYQRALAEVARLDAAIRRAGSQTAAAAATAEVAAARLDDTVIRSPIDGVVIARDRNPGDMIAPGTTIFRLVDPRTLVVAARFDEELMGMVDAGAAASVTFNAEPRRAIPGRVLRLHREVDQETREFVVDVALSALPRNWALGQRATVTLDFAAPAPALAVDRRFVARRDGRAGLWVAEGGRARWRPVSLGLPGGERVEITAGLAPGAVVLDPAGRYELEPVVPKERGG
jgi:HlyD family secretion protein